MFVHNFVLRVETSKKIKLMMLTHGTIRCIKNLISVNEKLPNCFARSQLSCGARKKMTVNIVNDTATVAACFKKKTKIGRPLFFAIPIILNGIQIKAANATNMFDNTVKNFKIDSL